MADLRFGFILLMFFISIKASHAQENVTRIMYTDSKLIQRHINPQFDTTYILANYQHLNGKVIVYYDTSFKRKAIESDLSFGLKNGTYTYWYRNGMTKLIEHHKNGVVTGKSEEWNILGVKTYEGNYTKGVYDGFFKNWYGNGVLKNECFYNMGVLEGNVRTFYISGKRASNEFYNANFGEKDGIDSAWFENGNLQYVKPYKLGVTDGIHTAYYENGGKRFQIPYRNEIMEGDFKMWENNGQLTKSISYVNNFPTKCERYYPTGEKLAEIYFKAESFTPSKWTFWDKKGNEIDRKKAPQDGENEYTYPDSPSNSK